MVHIALTELAKMYENMSNSVKKEGSFCHMWWTCTKVLDTHTNPVDR